MIKDADKRTILQEKVGGRFMPASSVQGKINWLTVFISLRQFDESIKL